MVLWSRLRRFLLRSFKKLHAKRTGPYKIARKFSINDYKLELPLGMNSSTIVNMKDLTPYRSPLDTASALPEDVSSVPASSLVLFHYRSFFSSVDFAYTAYSSSFHLLRVNWRYPEKSTSVYSFGKILEVSCEVAWSGYIRLHMDDSRRAVETNQISSSNRRIFIQRSRIFLSRGELMGIKQNSRPTIEEEIRTRTKDMSLKKCWELKGAYL